MCEVGPPASRRPHFTRPIRASRSRGIPPCGAGRLPPPTAVQRQENNPGDSGMYEFETNSGAKTIEAGIGDDGTGAIETRKGNTPIKVWVTPGEKRAIETSTRSCGMSTSAYLR